MSRVRLICLFLLIAGASAVVPAAAGANHSSGAPIHPGVMTFTQGAQCTSNFVFADAGGAYLGQAAHCAGTGAATETNGCDADSLPLGTEVEIDGATQPGTLVYSSWIAMQQTGETDPDACDFNDFALVRIDPADADDVDPTVPGFGGPTGLGPSASTAQLGDTVFSYQNSSLRFGVPQLSPKEGRVIQSEGSGWSRTLFTLTPGVPGDSGSGFLDASGRAIGVLSTLQVAPLAGTNGVGDLRSALDYMRAHSDFDAVALVPGDEPFEGDLAGAVLGG